VLLYTKIKFFIKCFAILTKNFLICSQSISPGGVKTELAEASGFPKEALEQFKDSPYLEAKDIADSVMYVLGTPPHVQVSNHSFNS
jgi:NADP-dependent 3-hydroxy acid dehydrogenase YdfG